MVVLGKIFQVYYVERIQLLQIGFMVMLYKYFESLIGFKSLI